MDLQAHIELAVTNAEAGISKLPEEILKMEGMTGIKTRHFYNNLLNKEGIRYLEIGAWKGSSVCSAMYGNSAQVYVIDNWSEFGGPRDDFLVNLNKFKGSNTTNFQEADSFKVDVKRLPKFNFYLYDGEHTTEAHSKALTHYIEAMDETFVYICDDWNWDGVREGTYAGIKQLGLEIVWSKEIRMTNDGSHTPQPLASQTWHNGIYMAILKKPQPAVKYAIIINAFNRSDYLHRCLNGLFNCDGLENWAIFYNQDGLSDGGYCDKTAKVANKWLDAIATKTYVYRKFHDSNKNIAIRQYDAINHAFYTYGADHIIIMEDDTVPGRGYLDTCRKLFQLAETDDEVAYISGNYTSNLQDKHKPVVKLGILHLQITWLGGHSRAKYDKIKDLHADAHKRIFIDGSYHPETPELWANWHKTLELLGLEKSDCYCQDSLLCLCYKKAGMPSLLCTTERHALPIGEVGMHFNPKFFKEQNYGEDMDWDNSALDDSHFFKGI